VIYLSIRYTLDHNKLKDFEDYARHWPPIIRRCGGELVGYFLPTRFAGPTNAALALIGFADLPAYQKYREALAADAEARDNVARVEKAGCIVNEDRAFVDRIQG
jgi:NIPSNAP